MTRLHQDRDYRVLKGFKPHGCESEGRWAGSFDFKCEYAKSNRSTCRLCNNNIELGHPRLALMMVSIEGDCYKNTFWYHMKCFFKHHEALKLLDPAKEMVGFADLKSEDKTEILAEHRAMQAQYAADSKIANSFKNNAGFRFFDDDGDSDDHDDSDDDNQPRRGGGGAKKKKPSKATAAKTKKAKKAPATKKATKKTKK